MLGKESSDFLKDYKNLSNLKIKMKKKLKIGKKDNFKEFDNQIGQIKIIWLSSFMEPSKKDKKPQFSLPTLQLKPLLIMKLLQTNLMKSYKTMPNLSPNKQAKKPHLLITFSQIYSQELLSIMEDYIHKIH